MSNALSITASPRTDEYKMMKQQAADMISSGFLPKAIQKPEQALAIMMKGRELNLPPWTALSNIHIIEGKPTLSADLMAALVQRAIDQKGDGELTSLPPTDTGATVRYRRWNQQEVHEYTFTMKDAAAAGLTTRSTWKAHPKSMLRARALAHACRAGFPDVVAGMYDPDELQAITIDPTPPAYMTADNLPPTARTGHFDAKMEGFEKVNQRVEAQEIIDGEYVDKSTGEIQGKVSDDEPNQHAPSGEPANKALKQWVWDRAKEVFGTEGRTAAIKTLLELDHAGVELSEITVAMGNSLIDAMDDPEGVRAYIAAMNENGDADTQIAHDEAEAIAWKQKITDTPPSRWSSLYQEAFSEVWKGVAMVNAAPHIGALKMIEGRAKKDGAIEPLADAIARRKAQLEAQAKAS